MSVQIAHSGKMIAVGYCRVSTADQAAEGVSLAAQREKIEMWASLNEAELAAVYEDAGVTGSSMKKRPGLQDALAMACKDKCALVTYSLSRLARSTRDAMKISDRLEKAGADLVSLTEQIDTTTAAGKMVFRMLAVLAEFERDIVAERTEAAMARLRAEGRRISRIIPFGYRLADDGRTLLKEPSEQKALVQIARLRSKGTSYLQIGEELTKMGIKTRTGRDEWSPSTIRGIVRRINRDCEGVTG